MNDAREQSVNGTPDREELGISTGLMEWFESAPGVIEGRLVTRPGREKALLQPLSGYQVELPSRRWLMDVISKQHKNGADGKA